VSAADWYAPNQQAVRADESGPAEEGDGGTPATTTDTGDGGELDGLTKDELIQVASDRGIDVPASATKAEIREALEAG
jgi:hypothetical protein